jgi:dephospho-CoA kinase
MEFANFYINSIVVYIPKDLQIKRLIKRDKCNKNDALSRINSQMDIEDKKQLATFIIDNTKDLRSLQNEVERVKKLLLEKI